MSRPIATLILNRNLPDITDRLADHLMRWNGDVTDLYVVESGSAPERRSRHASFIADWPEAVRDGLRFPRGFNFGLLELEKRQRYPYYFLVCQDSVFPDEPTLSLLLEEMERYPLIGILSASSPDWGESRLIPPNETRLFWFVNHISWLYRGELIDRIKNVDNPTYINYLYDGTNFRGYDTDIELIAKAYANDFAVGITARATFREDSTLTDRLAAEMQTDPQAINRPRMYEEGMRWLRRKYGFNSRWNMITYVKAFYNQFFENHPEYQPLRV
jgi:hypothetical protein